MRVLQQVAVSVFFMLVLMPRVGLANNESSGLKDSILSAPEFALETVQGRDSGSLAAHRGKVVVIEFWATYCGWCKKTHPALAAFAKKHGDKVAVLGISSQKKSRLLRYLRHKTLGFTALHDARAVVAKKYKARSTPTLVVVDGEGKLRHFAVGGNKLASTLKFAESLLPSATE